MSTINDIERSFLEKEIHRIKVRIDFYRQLYLDGAIKCLTLKKLLQLKEQEAKLLELTLERRNGKEQ